MKIFLAILLVTCTPAYAQSIDDFSEQAMMQRAQMSQLRAEQEHQHEQMQDQQREMQRQMDQVRQQMSEQQLQRTIEDANRRDEVSGY